MALPGVPETDQVSPGSDSDTDDAATIPAVEDVEYSWNYQTPQAEGESTGTGHVIITAERVGQNVGTSTGTRMRAYLVGDELEAPPVYDWILGSGPAKPSDGYIDKVKTVLQQGKITRNWLPRVCSSPDALNFNVCKRSNPQPVASPSAV